MTMSRLPVALILAGGLAAGCGGGGSADGHAGAGGAAGAAGVREPSEVALVELAPSAVPRVVEAPGSIEAWSRVAPGTKILGRVGRVAVREGDRVARGALLAELEQRDLVAAVDQARAAVAVAEAQLENAAAQHRRMTELHGRGSVTDKNLEDATNALRVAEAQRTQAEAGVAAAEVTLGYAAVRSPVAGWVVEKRVEPGDMAAPGAALFVVEDLSRVKVAVQLAESDVVGLAAGDPARVLVGALGIEREAAVDRVIPAGDPASRTFRVELTLDNPDGALKSGMYARARFSRGTREALLVPASARVERGQLDGVFAVGDDGVARLRWVRVGPAAPTSAAGEDRIEILSGLAAGDRVVVSPPPGFADGTPVRAAER